jgi:hypothetical protein
MFPRTKPFAGSLEKHSFAGCPQIAEQDRKTIMPKSGLRSARWERMPIKGQRIRQLPAGRSFFWPGVVWVVVMISAVCGLYYLHQNRIVTEEQLMLSIFVAVPVFAFLLSGKGQDISES